MIYLRRLPPSDRSLDPVLSNDCTTARSASALGGPAPYWTSWAYKPGGLRDTQTEHKTTGNTATAYGYPAVNASGRGQPHTMTSLTVNGVPVVPRSYLLGGATRHPCTGESSEGSVCDASAALSRRARDTVRTCAELQEVHRHQSASYRCPRRVSFVYR